MAFPTAAGFATFKASTGSSVRPRVATLPADPERRQAETGHGCDRALDGISIGLFESANETQRRELEAMGRRMDAAHQLERTVTSLKDRVARRIALRPTLACTDDTVELAYKAS
jgi:hypothetical protein